MYQEGLSVGAGLNLALGATGIHLDYAWQDYGVCEDLHRFALQLAY